VSRKIAIASDHVGTAYRLALKTALAEWEWIDLGPVGAEKVDYPDFAQEVARAIVSGRATCGVLICGSGIGMSMAANKVAGIRAAVVESTTAARFSRQQNDANILCLGARLLAPEYGVEITRVWLETPFDGGDRHMQRLAKIERGIGMSGPR
jgi:ribose 5-phosphate isomerase B